MATMSENLEALTAEMLGDIGKLHASVQQLKTDLPTTLQPLNETRQQLAVVINKLMNETEASKKQHAALLNDSMTVGLNEIKAMTQGQIEAMDKAAQHITADEREAMFENARQAREAAVIGTLETIERTVAQGLKGVSSANQTFGVTGEHFRMQIDSCVGAAKKSVGDFDQALKIAAQDHEPMGKGAYFMLSMATVVITLGAAVLLASNGFFSGEAKLSKTQEEAILRAARFEQVYGKLDAKTKARIDTLWNQK